MCRNGSRTQDPSTYMKYSFVFLWSDCNGLSCICNLVQHIPGSGNRKLSNDASRIRKNMGSTRKRCKRFILFISLQRFIDQAHEFCLVFLDQLNDLGILFAQFLKQWLHINELSVGCKCG